MRESSSNLTIDFIKVKTIGYRHKHTKDRVITKGEDCHLGARKRGHQKTLTLMTPRPLTSSLYNYEEINFCC